VKFGKSLRSEGLQNGIEEGKDVYFECSIRSNPASIKVEWRHNVSFVFLFFPLLVSWSTRTIELSWTLGNERTQKPSDPVLNKKIRINVTIIQGKETCPEAKFLLFFK
jgi:hypothetical protein